MSKRIIYSIVATLVIGLGILLILHFNPIKKNTSNSIFDAIPSESPLIIKIDEPVAFFKSMQSNKLILSLLSINGLNDKFQGVERFFEFLKLNDTQLIELFKGKQTILSFNYTGKDEIDLLLLFKLNSRDDLNIMRQIESATNTNAAISIDSRKYNKTTINEITSPNYHYFLAEDHGIIMLSQKSILVEEAIRQRDIDLTIQHHEILPLLKTIDNQADVQIFIHHAKIDQLLSKNLSRPMKKRTALLGIYSGWSELDLNLKDDKLLLSGFSNGNIDDNLYGNIFLNQKAANSKIDKVLPQQTCFYLNLCVSDYSEFYQDYTNFLDKRNLLLQHQDQLKKIESTTGNNLQTLFSKIIDHDIALAGIEADQDHPTTKRIWIVETKSGKTAIGQMIDLQNTYLNSKQLNAEKWSNEYQIDNQTSFTIYRFPFPNLPQLLFGQIFNGVETNWVTVYDNYLIFGDTFQTVAKAVRANILGETLSTSLNYSRNKTDMNARSTINFYCNTAVSLPIAPALFNQEISSQIMGNQELLKFKTFTWQVSSTGEMLYNNACLSYNSEIKSKPQTIWQSHIKANFDFKPKFVTNHTDPQNMEIVLQDKESNFYLINNVGRIEWQIKLDGSILGEIQQIDYYKNGKLQYLFNTENKLYLVDRDGNFVKNFPINFRARATNCVSAFDYENNRDYRFFVACDDKLIYAYQIDGSLLDGWDMFKTDHIVTQAIQHFRVEGKDYIVASDLMKDYILHRTGKVRVPTDQIYPHSKNNTLYLEQRTSTHEPRIVTTESDGSIHCTYFDGKHEKLKNVELSENHYFIAENIDADDELEYIFADENLIYLADNNGKIILKKKMDATISHAPHVYSFSSQLKKIGVTCQTENKIYLFDINGNPHQGFPLDGCTEFSIGFISKENSNFNLLVGSPEGYLYNYFVE
ncbi:MAG: hypothetical protein ACERKD_06310 [Prolixibacteraceae bacterium]